MRKLDCSVVLVYPRPPFLDWALTVDPDGMASGFYDELRRAPLAFAIDECDGPGGREERIEELWPELLRRMLSAWSPEQRHWPDKLTRDDFDRWCRLQICPALDDLRGGVSASPAQPRSRRP